MNKRQAKEEAKNNTRTVGELLELVNNSSNDGMSKVNPSLTKEQALTIFRNALSARNPDEVQKGMVYSPRKDRLIMSADALGIMNILRECG